MTHFRLIKTAIGCMVLFSLLLQGCEKDESPGEQNSDKILTGIWKVSEMSSEYQEETITYSESQLDSMGLEWIYDIRDDYTLEQTTNMSGPLIALQGTWETSGNQLTMIITGPTGTPGTLVYEYTIEGNLLKLKWTMPSGRINNAEFTKQE